MKKVTLRQVSNKAMKDDAFWTSLRRGGPRALAANGLRLPAADRRRLAALLSLDGKTVKVHLDRFMKLARVVRPGGGLTWIGMWPRSNRPRPRRRRPSQRPRRGRRPSQKKR